MVSQFNPASAYSSAYPASNMSYGNNANLSLNSLYNTQMFASGYGQINGTATSLSLGPSLSNAPIFSMGQQAPAPMLPPPQYDYGIPTVGQGQLGMQTSPGSYFTPLSGSAGYGSGAAAFPAGMGAGIPNATTYGNTPGGLPTGYQPYSQGQSSYGMGNPLSMGGQPPIYSNEQPNAYETLPRGIAQTFNHIGFDAYGRLIGNLYDMASNGLNAFMYRNRVVGPVDPSSLTSYGYVSNPGMVAYVSGVGPGSAANVTRTGTSASGGAQAWLFNPVSGTLQDYSGPPRV